VTWTRTTTLGAAPIGSETDVHLRAPSGAELGVAPGHFFPFDHQPGGLLFAPETEGLVDPVALAAGAAIVLDRVRAPAGD
jgi:hypothetical protein